MKRSLFLFASMLCFGGINAQTDANLNSYVSNTNSTNTKVVSLLNTTTYSEPVNNVSGENKTGDVKTEVPSTERRRVRIGEFATTSTDVAKTEVKAEVPATTALSNATTNNVVNENNNSIVKNVTTVTDVNSNNNFHVSYSLLNGGQFKYAFHIEGRVKDCRSENKIPHAYISVNSAIVKDKYEIIPTNTDGRFSIDITDDSIGSITIIKKGYEDKEIALNSISVNEKTSYGFEVCMEKTDDGGNNILAATETVSKAGQLYFDFNKTTLKKETTELLDSVINNIKATTAKSTTIEINGYADSKGSKEYNLQLSKARSLACKNYMVKHGVKNVKIKINALGATPLGVKDEAESARAKNRRVDILIHSKQKGYTNLGA